MEASSGQAERQILLCLSGAQTTLTADDTQTIILIRRSIVTRNKAKVLCMNNEYECFLVQEGSNRNNLGPDCEEIKCLLKTGGSLPGQ